MEHSAAESALRPFLDLLIEWNAAIRLTGSVADEDLRLHVAEARSLLPFVPEEGRLVDIGSGGGFPGIVLALCRPALAITLVEPIAKKVAFLNTVRRQLGLENVVVERGRDEDFGGALDFEVATSQATFAPGVWFERARRLVRPGGRILALLGPEPGDLPKQVQRHRSDIAERERWVGVLEV